MPKYSIDDLDVRSTAKIKQEGKVIVQTHEVIFDRPLTMAERRLFAEVLVGFYHTVHFSQQFGNGLVGEPVVTFPEANQAQYTLRQTELHGTWKDLLFTILANFSAEIVPIRRHDDSEIFASVLHTQDG